MYFFNIIDHKSSVEWPWAYCLFLCDQLGSSCLFAWGAPWAVCLLFTCYLAVGCVELMLTASYQNPDSIIRKVKPVWDFQFFFFTLWHFISISWLFNAYYLYMYMTFCRYFYEAKTTCFDNSITGSSYLRGKQLWLYVNAWGLKHYLELLWVWGQCRF